MQPPQRKRLGLALVVGGILTIVVTVVSVLEIANGPGQPRTFAERRSYNQTKVALHEILPKALPFALLGLGLAWVGARHLERAAREAAAQSSSSEIGRTTRTAPPK